MIADIFDGKVWQHLLQLNNHLPFVGLLLSTDGFGPFSKSYSSWPIMAMVCNLPPSLRVNELLTLGLVPGPNKPKAFHPFVDIIVKEFQWLQKGMTKARPPRVEYYPRTILASHAWYQRIRTMGIVLQT